MSVAPDSQAKTIESLRDALNELVDALVSPALGQQTRSELVEDALVGATMTLGAVDVDRPRLYTALDRLGAELLVDKLERDHLQVYSLKVDAGDEQQAAIVATLSQTVSDHLDAVVEADALAMFDVN